MYCVRAISFSGVGREGEATTVTYPPELLPVPSPGDEVEIIVIEGDHRRVIDLGNPNLDDSPKVQ